MDLRPSFGGVEGAAYQGFSGDPLPEPGEPIGNPFDPLPTPETDRPAPPETLAPVSRVPSWDFDGLRGLFGVVTAAPDCTPALFDADPADPDPDPAVPPAPPPPPPCAKAADVMKVKDAAARSVSVFEVMGSPFRRENRAKTGSVPSAA